MFLTVDAFLNPPVETVNEEPSLGIISNIED